MAANLLEVLLCVFVQCVLNSGVSCVPAYVCLRMWCVTSGEGVTVALITLCEVCIVYLQCVCPSLLGVCCV